MKLLLFNFLIILVSQVISEQYCDNTTIATTTTTKKRVTAKTRKIKYWKCPKGWNYFSRQLGKWCIQVSGHTGDQGNARWNCWKKGAKLSGIENWEERNWIIDRGVEILRNLPGDIRQGALWVGAQRRTACRGNKRHSAGCHPWATNAYEWTDGFTTLKKMFNWQPLEPDYLKEVESCVQMAIINRTESSNGAYSGQLNDISCSVSTSTANINYMRGYVCGKRATPVYKDI